MVPDEGWFALLLAKLRGLEELDIQLRLFKNDFTPDEETVEADFTEADYSGYAPQVPVFPDPSMSGSVAESSAATLTFERTSGATSNTLYGWYATLNDGVDLRVVAAERFAFAPKSMNVEGDNVGVTWTITDRLYVAP